MYHYLVYLSSATSAFNEKDLTLILEKSRENNFKRDLTGLLIYIDGNIIQVLEGEKENIEKVFRKISIDGRHKGIIKIKEGSQKQRIFPDWSMGFKSMSKDELALLVGYRDLQNFEFDVEKEEKHPALILLNSFIKSNLAF